MLGLIPRYSALVGRNLDSIVQFWFPCHRIDVDSLMSVEDDETSYSGGEKCVRQGSASLVRRRVRGAMSEVFKGVEE